MSYTLKELAAELYKTVTITTEEIEYLEEGVAGRYVFRDNDGEKFMWGPRPYRYAFEKVSTVAEADQLMFLCPLCFAKNGGETGTHRVMVTLAGRNVPDDASSRDADGNPSRWTVVGGSTLDDLSLTPSILLDAKQSLDQGCHWHGFVGSSGIPAGSAG